MEKDGKCLRCGHEWKKRTEKPFQCPKCTSRIWFRPLTTPIIRKTKAKVLAPLINIAESKPILEQLEESTTIKQEEIKKEMITETKPTEQIRRKVKLD